MFRVDVDGLNLRSRPDSSGRKTIVAVLRRGHLVEKVAEARPGWWQVRVELRGQATTGFLASRYLVGAESFAEEVHQGEIPAVHMREGPGRLDRADAGAFPLSEPGQPRRTARTANAKVDQLIRIVDFLAVHESARYRSHGSTTFCNVYAYDYCTLAGVYLPRVWWRERALRRLADGEKVPVRYAETVRELTANDLFEWLGDWGDDFGWSRSTDLDGLQDAANQGQVSVICAIRKERERPGHISVVAPESSRLRAERSDGLVVKAVESQAGAANKKFGLTSNWWLYDRFADFGFWFTDETRDAVEA